MQFIHCGESLAGKHLPDARGGQFGCCGYQVVADNAGHTKRQPLLGNHRAQCLGTGLGIDPTGIGYDLDTARGDRCQAGLHRGADEIQGVAFGFVLGPGPGHDRHGDFGQVVVNDVIQCFGRQ